MNEHNGHRFRAFMEESPWLKIAKIWPIILFIASAIFAVGSFRQALLANIEKDRLQQALLEDHEKRMTRLEQAFIDMAEIVKEERKRRVH